ncbi:uncharacterized protein V6R79_011745 [Siganus canaliculatus]
MAGASDPLEDMLFSEVDEKAVSDLVGSLESQLAGQSNPAGKTDENGGAGSVAPANHHLGKTLPAPVGTTTLEQQQQGRRNKPEMRPEINSKDASPDKTVTSPSLGCSPSFGEPSTTSAAGVNATSSGLQSHRASITTLAASGVSTLASTPGSISITSSCKGCKVNPSAGEATSAEASPPRKRISTPRRNASARIKSLNGAAVMTRRNSNAAVAENVSTGDPGATTPNSTRPVTSSINTSTFTLSNANLPVGQSAIALDRGTPTIALHRLPNHIVASIAQNGNGTSVSALVQQQGTRIGPITSTAPQENHGKTITDTGASKTDDCHSKIVMSSQSGGVNSHGKAHSPLADTRCGHHHTVSTSSWAHSTSKDRSPPVDCQTTSAADDYSAAPWFYHPTGDGVGANGAGSARDGSSAGFGSSSGSGSGPEQHLSTTCHPHNRSILQSNNSTVSCDLSNHQAVSSDPSKDALPSRPPPLPPPLPPPPLPPVLHFAHLLLVTTSSSSSLSKGPVAPAVAVTAPQQTPVVMPPQALGQAASQPVQPPQTGIAATPGAPVVSQEMQENVKKCKNFLATLIKLASHNSPSPETSKNVKALVQDLLDAKIEPEEFTSRLQTELKSSPQPYLVPFLKKSLPALRLSLLNSQQSLTQPPQQGVKPAPGGTPPAVVAGPAVRIRHPNSVNTTVGASALPAGTIGHTAAMGIKTPGVVGGQVRMPVVITQSVRAQGAMGKGAVIQAGKSPMGLAVQISGNQKNKLNDPGGGSFRDDDDINDVASMAGVNLNEESARILATNSELVGTQIRSCKDEAFLHPGLLHRRILETAKKFGVTEVPMEAVTFISHATQSRLRTVVEKVSIIAQHRLDSCKDDECYEQSADVRSQLRFFEQLERMEKQRKDEQEREILLKAAKSRSRQEDPEQARLKQKAKEMQQQELAQMRQRDANLTALAAIGPRKKRKVDSPGTTPSGTEVSGSTAGSLSSPSTPSTSSRQYTRQRITRVNLRDLIFYMEQERETAHSLLLYRALLK